MVASLSLEGIIAGGAEVDTTFPKELGGDTDGCLLDKGETALIMLITTLLASLQLVGISFANPAAVRTAQNTMYIVWSEFPLGQGELIRGTLPAWHRSSVRTWGGRTSCNTAKCLYTKS